MHVLYCNQKNTILIIILNCVCCSHQLIRHWFEIIKSTKPATDSSMKQLNTKVNSTWIDIDWTAKFIHSTFNVYFLPQRPGVASYKRVPQMPMANGTSSSVGRATRMSMQHWVDSCLQHTLGVSSFTTKELEPSQQRNTPRAAPPKQSSQ